MAYACAYAALGNFSLAEEAAQEAFVTAGERLDQLRDAAAFPGWLRAIVHTKCSRLTRGGHLVLVPLEAASSVPAGAPDAQTALEDRQAGEEILALVRALPDGAAIAMLELNAEFYPESADIDLQLAQLNRTRGERAKAIARYRAAIAKDPKLEMARKGLEELEGTP